MKSIPVFDGTDTWRSTLHTHTHFCDGKMSPESYVNTALQGKLDVLGFSSHAPVPYPPGEDSVNMFWCMPVDRLLPYSETVSCLQRLYSSRLDIRKGLEIDYIPHVMGPRHPVFRAMNLDYCIGSVHAAAVWPNGHVWTVDCEPDTFMNGISVLFGGSVEKAGSEYYRRIRDMVSEQPPDIIGHIDLFRKNNKHLSFLDESAPWYRNAVFETLDAVAESNCIIEVNTGGMARGFLSDPYPSLFILKRCRELYIPVMINSDAHHPDNLTAHFDDAIELLRKAGY